MMLRNYANVSPQFWIGSTGQQLRQAGAPAQLLALYLVTNPHATMLGVYYLPLPAVAHETGQSLEATAATLDTLCRLDFCTYDRSKEYIWVHNMARFQIGTALKKKDNQLIAVHRQCENLPSLDFLDAFYQQYRADFHLPSRPVPSPCFNNPPHNQEKR